MKTIALALALSTAACFSSAVSQPGRPHIQNNAVPCCNTRVEPVNDAAQPRFPVTSVQVVRGLPLIQ